MLRALVCGVGGADVRAWRGHTAVAEHAILGREVAGEVVAVGSGVKGFRIGDLAALGSYCGGGGGGFSAPLGCQAGYVRVEQADTSLHRVPASSQKPLNATELLLATSHGAAGLAAARTVLRTATELPPPAAGTAPCFAVVGAGPTGLLAAASLRAELGQQGSRRGAQCLCREICLMHLPPLSRLLFSFSSHATAGPPL